jgi:hypothetical protein
VPINSKTQNNTQPDEVQIPQPDLRIVPCKQDKTKTNSSTGPGPKAETPPIATKSIDGAFNPIMHKSKTCHPN